MKIITRSMCVAVSVALFSQFAVSAEIEKSVLKAENAFNNVEMDFSAVIPLPAKPAAYSANSYSEDVYTGDPRSVTIERHNSDKELSTVVDVPIYKVYTTYELVTVSYEELVCSDIAGDGKGNWHGFYNAPSRTKAQKLADAVAGIGEKTAQCVVNSNAFNSKPRTWREFKSAMKRADSDCGKGLYYRTVVQYGKQNAENLGYAGGVDCVVNETVELILKPVEKKDYVKTISLNFKILIDNAPLLPSETEQVTCLFDGFKAMIETNSRYNYYEIIREGESSFRLKGQRRLASPNNSLELEYIPQTSANSAVIRVNDSDYIKDADSAQAQTFVHITVRRPKSFWFDEKVCEADKLLQNGKGEININKLLDSGKNPIKSGEKFYVEYSLVRSNSRFNNDSKSNVKDTPGFVR